MPHLVGTRWRGSARGSGPGSGSGPRGVPGSCCTARAPGLPLAVVSRARHGLSGSCLVGQPPPLPGHPPAGPLCRRTARCCARVGKLEASTRPPPLPCRTLTWGRSWSATASPSSCPSGTRGAPAASASCPRACGRTAWTTPPWTWQWWAPSRSVDWPVSRFAKRLGRRRLMMDVEAT